MIFFQAALTLEQAILLSSYHASMDELQRSRYQEPKIIRTKCCRTQTGKITITRRPQKHKEVQFLVMNGENVTGI